MTRHFAEFQVAATRPGQRAAVLALLLVAAALPARADRIARPATDLPAYQQECASCHVAYPPALLPATSWRQIMRSLDRHYGSDAALDERTTAQLAAWLEANAGQGKHARQAPPENRITRAAWFLKEHSKVDAAVWKRPAVRSASHCAACHTGAEQGDFRERNIVIPR